MTMPGPRARALLASLVTLAACRTPADVRQGGADFRAVQVAPSAVPLEALFGVCWPAEARAAERVVLRWLPGEVLFEVREGASNSTGRCLREIASTVPLSPRPTGDVEVGPPAQPLDGWAVLAWVKLLSPARFGPERGLTDPAPAVRACLTRGALRPSTAFTVRHVPDAEVRVRPDGLGEVERCVEAVLGSTAWPSPRALFFTLQGPRGAPEAAGEVGLYFSPPSGAGAPLEPARVKGVLQLAQPRVARCWDQALARRPSLGGARTLRFRVNEAGEVLATWVVGSVAAGPVAADWVLDACLAEVVAGQRFGPGAGEGVYTWIFAARG